jgi:hypothetical protein
MKTQEEIEQLAESQYGTEIGSIRGSNPYDLEGDRKNGYIKGYNQCQEDMADKKYTKEDLENAFNSGRGYGVPDNIKDFNSFINSLNKQD